jgi:XisH protein
MAKDIFHDAVKHALEKDGWTITHEHYPLRDKERDMRYDIDLYAEKLIAAQRGPDKIAVEVKSLLQPSLTYEFHGLLGKFLIYLHGINLIEPDRKLYVAIPLFAWNKISQMKGLMEIITIYQVKIIIFKSNSETIVQWIK